MKLEITSEKVLAAASKCSTAEATLKVLFPEVFEEKSNIIIENDSDANLYTRKGNLFKVNGTYAFQVRMGGAYDKKGFYLNPTFEWMIINEGLNSVLVPTLKKKY